MKKTLLIILMILFSTTLYAFSLSSLMGGEESKSETSTTALISQLTSSLGVTNTQAVGGATALLSNAATKMSQSDKDSLVKSIPELSQYMGGGSSSLLTSIAANSTVQQQFSALGLSSDMISQYTPIILQFIDSQAGKTLMNIVKSSF